jgi:class 3 adenylate cyclase
MAETRKLAAILAADVAGYSRLAAADEDRTLARMRALRSDLIDPTIAPHHGRVVKGTALNFFGFGDAHGGSDQSRKSGRAKRRPVGAAPMSCSGRQLGDVGGDPPASSRVSRRGSSFIHWPTISAISCARWRRRRRSRTGR